jgi:hypothetical protein
MQAGLPTGGLCSWKKLWPAAVRWRRLAVGCVTNWSEYEPWWLEVQAVFKRFDRKFAKRPAFPKIIELPPLAGFVKLCSVEA